MYWNQKTDVVSALFGGRPVNTENLWQEGEVERQTLVSHTQIIEFPLSECKYRDKSDHRLRFNKGSGFAGRANHIPSVFNEDFARIGRGLGTGADAGYTFALPSSRGHGCGRLQFLGEVNGNSCWTYMHSREYNP
jgi:hypothetical protein